MTTEPLAFGVTEAARLLSVGKTSIYGLIHDGRLTPVKVRGRTLLLRSELDRFVNDLAKAA